jgi:hypothetical protein
MTDLKTIQTREEYFRMKEAERTRDKNVEDNIKRIMERLK